MTVCLWGISVGLRLGLGLLCRVRDPGMGGAHAGLVDESDRGLLACCPEASSLLAVTYPGRSPEGAKIPLPGGPTVGISVKLLSLKTGLYLVPPGLE